MNKIKVDTVIDLSWGDTGKGKVSHNLLKKEKYTHVLRFSGGNNCGHTIYHNSKKFVTHIVPCGVFYGVKSIVGPGCVVNPKHFLKELEELEREGVSTTGLVRIAYNAHTITEKHLNEETSESKVGTTKTGNGPAYRDKYDRKGIRAESIPELKEFLVDMHQEFYCSGKDSLVLGEGAQGFYLDPDWGDYPYVTSGHCGIGSILLNGFNPKQIRDVYGVIKAYDTYVGANKFQPSDDPVFSKIQQAGKEYGATTGRLRQVNFLNFDRTLKAIEMNGVDHLVVNKVDILREVETWKLYYNNQLLNLENENSFRSFISEKAKEKNNELNVLFSDSPQ
jgi:adenylosuccinate synthase